MPRTGRPTWQPDERQAAALDQVARLHEQAKEADRQYREALASAEAIGVTPTALAERLGMTRKSVYRALGRSMT